jgi:hypothetical protein
VPGARWGFLCSPSDPPSYRCSFLSMPKLFRVCHGTTWVYRTIGRHQHWLQQREKMAEGPRTRSSVSRVRSYSLGVQQCESPPALVVAAQEDGRGAQKQVQICPGSVHSLYVYSNVSRRQHWL